MPKDKNLRFSTDYFVIEETMRTGPFTMTDKHFHPECEIYYLLEGEGKFYIGQDSFRIKAGSLVLINSSQVHRSCFQDCDYHHRVLIELHPDHFGKTISTMLKQPLAAFFQELEGVFQVKKDHEPYLKNLLGAMIWEARDKHGGYEAMIAMKISELMIFLTRPENKVAHFVRQTHEAPKENRAVVESAIVHIGQNLSAPLSLDIIARELFINKSYLSRVFKETTNMTVHEYINIQRVQLARRLFEDTQLSVEDVAGKTGYNTVAYFERVFKKYTESTPVGYVKKLKNARTSLRGRNDI
ncbi:MAG: AraC family transcriptional regulator [Turicibacter sp.]|nr:AraC family transcriptional regulator [Turicibacter sp.]